MQLQHVINTYVISVSRNVLSLKLVSAFGVYRLLVTLVMVAKLTNGQKMCIFLQFVAKVDYIVNKCCYWLNTFGAKIRKPSPLPKRILAKLYIILYKYKTLFSVTFMFQLFKIYCV